jgi:hypothetical protein
VDVGLEGGRGGDGEEREGGEHGEWWGVGAGERWLRGFDIEMCPPSSKATKLQAKQSSDVRWHDAAARRLLREM